MYYYWAAPMKYQKIALDTSSLESKWKKTTLTSANEEPLTILSVFQPFYVFLFQRLAYIKIKTQNRF